MEDRWKFANRISDEIAGVLNREKDATDFSPVQMLAGQLLALVSYLRTTDEIDPATIPAPVLILRAAAETCLDAIVKSKVGLANPANNTATQSPNAAPPGARNPNPKGN
ncbi:MAG: hypothetical protein PHC88_05480 [Terrimicrobiaceae bacterium]|nr:hypothetical protein [Terrimicrobiaceae bacterium]